RNQECLACDVDRGHARQVEAMDGLARTGQAAPPAILRLAHPGTGQPAFELNRQRSRGLVDGDPEHHFPSPGRPLTLPSPPSDGGEGRVRGVSATAFPPSMNTSSCWPT